MSKILVVLLSFFVIAVMPLNVLAQEDSTTTTSVEEDSITPTATKRAQTLRSTTANTVMEAKDAMLDKMSQARSDFKERMQEIKDTRKQQILEKLVERINENNKKKTDHMLERLERLTSILARLSEMSATFESNGVDVTTLNSEIADANTAIEEAKTAVSEQAAKDYLVDITTENALRTNARAAIQEYIADIKAVHQKIVAAHRAVVKASTTAKALQANQAEESVTE